MKKIFIVKYSVGSHESYKEKTIFATEKKSTATKYVTKFNRMLSKWKTYYSQFEDDRYGFPWIMNRFIDQHYRRWHRLTSTNICWWEEVEIR
jgi:hypothetical protein